MTCNQNDKNPSPHLTAPGRSLVLAPSSGLRISGLVKDKSWVVPASTTLPNICCQHGRKRIAKHATLPTLTTACVCPRHFRLPPRQTRNEKRMRCCLCLRVTSANTRALQRAHCLPPEQPLKNRADSLKTHILPRLFSAVQASRKPHSLSDSLSVLDQLGDLGTVPGSHVDDALASDPSRMPKKTPATKLIMLELQGASMAKPYPKP